MRVAILHTLAALSVLSFAAVASAQTVPTPVYKEWMPKPSTYGGGPVTAKPVPPKAIPSVAPGSQGDVDLTPPPASSAAKKEAPKKEAPKKEAAAKEAPAKDAATKAIAAREAADDEAVAREAAAARDAAARELASKAVGQPVTTTAAELDVNAAAPAEKPEEKVVNYTDADGAFHAFVDAVFGFGVTPVLNQNFVGPYLPQEKRTLTNSRFATQSVNVGIGYDVLDALRASVMLPLGGGSLYPESTSRQTSVVGNLTLSGEYQFRHGTAFDVYAGLGVALPTATGEPLPASDDLAKTHVNQTDRDRYSVQRAMSDSRGREDISSFTPNHLGLVPKLGAIGRPSRHVEIEPWVSYASLHATDGAGSYVGALVVGGRGTYRFSQLVDATVRVWGNIPTAGDASTTGFAEPQLRGHFGPIMPTIGVILPIAGELKDPYTIGARAALAARF